MTDLKYLDNLKRQISSEENRIEYKQTPIKEMREDDRPQEKLFSRGVDSLSTAELIGLIIRTGSGTKTAVGLGSDILELAGLDGIRGLLNLDLNKIMKIRGIKHAKAASIMAAIELGKRISLSSPAVRLKCNESHIIPQLLMDELGRKHQEIFMIACLNTKKELIKFEKISLGTLDCSIVHSRDVFRKAIDNNAHSIILIHNHPSGDTYPSNSDKVLTERLIKAGEIIGIEVIDHVIIGDNKYFSFRERDLM